MVLAFIFNDVGVGEWLVLLAVVLIVVGPRRLPEVARKLGSYYAKFRQMAEGFRRELLAMERETERAVSKVPEIGEASGSAEDI